MSISAKPMAGAKITVDENGQIGFWHWEIKHDGPSNSRGPWGLAILDYLRDRIENENGISRQLSQPPSPAAS